MKRKFKLSELVLTKQDLLSLEEGMLSKMANSYPGDRERYSMALAKVQNLIYIYQQFPKEETPDIFKVLEYIDEEDCDEQAG